MSNPNKQFLHYQNTAKQSLDKFKRILKGKKTDEISQLLTKDWQSFVDDKSRLQRYIDHVKDVAGIFGFSRELSDKLNYDELTSRVAERFAEVDLAEHAIRELDLPKTGGKLEKLSEGTSKRCDFKFSGNPPYYFESKYTKNLAINHLTKIIQDALEQIKNSMSDTGIGCIWVFTYVQPDDLSGFQQEVMAIKNKFSRIGFEFNLSVQVYSHGLYGDATVI